ncbi:hypothetical protein AZ20_2255 [Bordetella bronchiseptica E014]|nr:hypothetical protein AZ20_2255 [Bordetella bronchiseptica E014]
MVGVDDGQAGFQHGFATHCQPAGADGDFRRRVARRGVGVGDVHGGLGMADGRAIIRGAWRRCNR